MSELRLTGKTEDGNHLALVDNDGGEYTLRISDTLRATVNQPRLTSVPTHDAQDVMSVREIQKRLRAGESFEQIAREGQISVEKVERFSGPIMQEREYILDRAREIIMRRDAHRIEENFLDVVRTKLAPRGVDTDEITWNTWRLPDTTWHIELHYPNRDGNGSATWVFDLARRALSASDENGAWLIDEDAPVRVAKSEPGLVYAEPAHPSRSESSIPRISDLFEPAVQPDADPVDEVTEINEPPRLAVIRETPTAADSEDGITARAKVPSWDEIMFGRKPEED
jgi:hypothetical protein